MECAFKALETHPGNAEISEQAILVLVNLAEFARSLECVGAEQYVKDVAYTLSLHYEGNPELCASGLELLNALLELAKPVSEETKARALKAVNALLIRYSKEEAFDSRLCMLGASALVRLLCE